MSEPSPPIGRPQRVVIVGGGFAGFHAARGLSRRLAQHPRSAHRALAGRIETILINPVDYLLYLPLLPEVAGGILDPRRVAVPLADVGPGVRLMPGTVEAVDLDGRQVGLADAEGHRRTMRYDRLLLTVGTVGKLLPVPGVAEHALGFRSISEALALRDHLVRQVELAAATAAADERDARCTFVVVGAGYTGTEVAAHGQLLTRAVARRHAEATRPADPLAAAGYRPADPARTAPAPGAMHQPGCSPAEASRSAPRPRSRERPMTGCCCPTANSSPPDRSSGASGSALTRSSTELGLPTTEGRLVVDDCLSVPGHPEIFACGDAGAVPDRIRPGQLTAMTAQHAVRQGRLAAANIAASLGHGRPRPYRHHDLGFLVDLGGAKAAANPAGIRLSGLPAKAVTRGYHLAALPANKIRDRRRLATRRHPPQADRAARPGRATTCWLSRQAARRLERL